MDWTKLEWERIGKPLSHDDDCLYAYVVRAEKDGIQYEGTGEYCCDELLRVEDIEVISLINTQKVIADIMDMANKIINDYGRK